MFLIRRRQRRGQNWKPISTRDWRAKRKFAPARTIFRASTDQGCRYGDDDLALSSNQTQFEASSYLYDSNLNAQSFLTLNDREALNTSYVYGAKLSPNGSLLFQPSTNGLDVYDGRLGILLTRIALSFPLSANYDALVSEARTTS